MLIVMDKHATEQQIKVVMQRIRDMGFVPVPVTGAQRTAIGITGNQQPLEAVKFTCLEGVKEAIPVSKPYKLVSREFRDEDTVVTINNVSVGGGNFTLIAGPCAVESIEQCMAVAQHLAKAGIKIFRGGAFKPRTSPYSFQGLGEEGLKILAKVRQETGLLIVTEAVDHETIQMVEEYADIIQIGARNMQHFTLLKRAGRSNKPILLKRGMSATIEELLMAAEYIMYHGNKQIILCERGVRTFADHTRNTLDLSAIPAVKSLSHLPIIVDPSHAAGRREQVIPLSRGALAVGADGLMVEVHNDPVHALCDGPQSLILEEFDSLMETVKEMSAVKNTY